MAEIIIAPDAPAPITETPLDAKELVLKMLEKAEEEERVCALEVCALIKAVGIAAKDLHYRAKGEAFYSEHLLADLGWQIEKLTDDFIEVYYMGDKGWTPPLMKEIYGKACSDFPFIDKENEDSLDTEFWARRLLKVCEDLVGKVEKAKGILAAKAGTQASLDEISKQVLQVIGLLKRNLK